LETDSRSLTAPITSPTQTPEAEVYSPAEPCQWAPHSRPPHLPYLN
jgi:hypothetical protein